MKKFLNEFKDFINRGNAMDLAVGVIIGSAFTAIVTSLTDDLIYPFITLVTGGGADGATAGLVIPVAGTENGIDFGAFLTAIINFLIVAFVVFCLIKALNSASEMAKKAKGAEEEAPAAPTHEPCPHCLEDIKIGATRCPHCAGEVAAK